MSATIEARQGLGSRKLPTLTARTTRRRGERLLPTIVLIGVGVLWEIIGQVAGFLYLPPLSEILVALWELFVDGTIPRELVASATAFAIGMAISVGVGMLLGVLMGVSRTIRRTLDVYVDALMTAPIVAFVPLFIMLFGLGVETRVATVVLFAIFPVIINTMAGIREVDQNLLLMGRSFGTSQWKSFTTIRLPSAYPHIQTGLRTASARGVDGVITGEVLIAAVGLGGMISRFGNAFSMPRLYATVFVIIALVLLATRLFDVIGLVVPRRPGQD